MPQRKVQTLVNSSPGTTFTSGVDIFGTGLEIKPGNKLRFGIKFRTATILSFTTNYNNANQGAVKENVALVANADYIFESSYNGDILFNVSVSATTIIDKFLVEVYLEY